METFPADKAYNTGYQRVVDILPGLQVLDWDIWCGILKDKYNS